MAEFELIKRLQRQVCSSEAAYADRCVLGIGDDAALFDVPPGRQLVACTDVLVEGVHFPTRTAAAAVGHKALAVNLSDLAAMGAEPAWFLLTLTLPEANENWLDAFAAGMGDLARRADIYLAGGDLAQGPLAVSVTAMGLVAPGRALTRSGAGAGDLVVVSGTPGAAAHALSTLRAGGDVDPRELAALEFPEPRLRLGALLPGLATACIDLSDGLLADLGHVLQESGRGAEIELHRLPCADSMAGLPEDVRWPLQLAGGDDYELCFTLPPEESGRLDELARAGGTRLTVVGRIREETGLIVRRPDGKRYDSGDGGYEHFGSPPVAIE